MPANRYESNISSLKISKQFLMVLVLLFVALMIWTFISIGASQNKTTLSAELITLSKPLNPTIDREILTTLETKTHIIPSEIGNFTIYKLVNTSDGKLQTVVPIDTDERQVVTPSSSPSATISPTATPTPSPESETLPEPTPDTVVN